MRAIALTVLVFSTTCLGQFRPSGTVSGSVGLAQGEAAEQKKSPLLAVALSLVVPGLGEMYSGNAETGKYFLAVDGALWLAYAGFVFHGNAVRDDARLFAAERAGADFMGKKDQFGIDVGNFSSMDEYNQAKLRNREFDLVYSGAAYAWEWKRQEDRTRFRQLRIKGDELLRSSEFVVGGLVVNRIISAFTAWRSASVRSDDRAGGDGWTVRADVQGGILHAHGLGLTLTASF